MRVLLFHFAQLGGLGGVEVAVVTLADSLRRRGFPAGITEIAPERTPLRVSSSGIPVWSVTSPSYPNLWHPRSWASFTRSVIEFQKALREFRPDIVHVHYPVAQCLPMVGASLFSHKWKLIVTVHNSDIRVSPVQEPELRTWQRRLFARADALTAVSQSLLDDAAQLYADFRSKGQVVHNGVGPEWFQLPLERESKTDYVLFAGRLHTVKGVDLLLTAWKAVSPRFPRTELWIIGDGPEKQNLEDLAGELGLSTVRFLGPKPPPELPTFYRDARAVVLPSRREGLPISLLEAGACGAICIGSDTPGIPEIIEEGITGHVVAVESPEDIAKAISRVLELSPERFGKMREAARGRIASRFSERGMIEKYLLAYQALLN